MGLEEDINRLLENESVRHNALVMCTEKSNPNAYMSQFQESIGGNAGTTPEGVSCYGINFHYDEAGKIVYVGNIGKLPSDARNIPSATYLADIDCNLIHLIHFAGSPLGREERLGPYKSRESYPVPIRLVFQAGMPSGTQRIVNVMNTAFLYNLLWSNNLRAEGLAKTFSDLTRVKK